MAKRKKQSNSFTAVLVVIALAMVYYTANMSSSPPHHRLSCHKLENLWVRAGGNPANKFMAAEIAMAESGGHQNATDYDSNGTVDRGYWQINSVHGSLSVYGALANAKAAIIISGNGSNWSAWVTYQNGAYINQC